jgi:hypothetical protein
MGDRRDFEKDNLRRRGAVAHVLDGLDEGRMVQRSEMERLNHEDIQLLQSLIEIGSEEYKAGALKTLAWLKEQGTRTLREDTRDRLQRAQHSILFRKENAVRAVAPGPDAVWVTCRRCNAQVTWKHYDGNRPFLVGADGLYHKCPKAKSVRRPAPGAKPERPAWMADPSLLPKKPPPKIGER